MKGRLFLLSAVTGTAVAVAVWFVMMPVRQVLENQPLHSAMEAVEALSVLLMAFFLLHRTDGGARDKLTLPALGFLAMGILNAAHAAAGPGYQFVFLRAAASLAGGFGFALVWLPERARAVFSGPRAVGSVAAGAVLLCVLMFLFGSLPVMISQGEFTAAAVTLNVLAGVLFIAGAAYFVCDLYRSNEFEDLLFGLIGALFGLSGLTFQDSKVWTEAWWFWHMLRLLASLLVLGLLVRRHFQAVRKLKDSFLERKQAEKSLKNAYNLTKTIIDSLNDAVSLLDVRDFTIVGVNRVFLENYGYSDESEVRGKHCYEITHRRSDMCSPPDDICPLIETARTKEHFSVDHVHYGKQGEKIYVEVSTSPIKDEAGNVVQVVHVQRDITDRKRAEQERERLLADLARSNRELEQFAYVASHDLQEPLRMVAGYVQLLERKYRGRLDEKADNYIHFAVDGAIRMQRLIDALLVYSRITTRGEEFHLVNMNDVFSQALANLTASISESGVRITKDDLPSVSGDETQLVQLFQNLIGNAIKYRQPDSLPEVTIASKKAGSGWIFSVGDNGIGMAPRDFDRVFQIFQRLHTRDQYPGTGMGLAICKRIVEHHHGRIWIESKSGKGSTFFFTLPAAQT